jgi:hypothetical protein
MTQGTIGIKLSSNSSYLGFEIFTMGVSKYIR